MSVFFLLWQNFTSLFVDLMIPFARQSTEQDAIFVFFCYSRGELLEPFS